MYDPYDMVHIGSKSSIIGLESRLWTNLALIFSTTNRTKLIGTDFPDYSLKDTQS